MFAKLQITVLCLLFIKMFLAVWYENVKIRNFTLSLNFFGEQEDSFLYVTWYIYTVLLFFYISPVIVYNFFNLWQLWLYMCRAWPRWIKICNTGVLTWAQWVNDPPCLCEGASSIFRSFTHWCGIDHRCGSYLIPGQGTFICCRGSWKRTKEKKKICNTVSVSDYTGKNSRLRPVVEIFILVL